MVCLLSSRTVTICLVSKSWAIKASCPLFLDNSSQDRTAGSLARLKKRKSQQQIQKVAGFTKESIRKCSPILPKWPVINMARRWPKVLRLGMFTTVRLFLHFLPSLKLFTLNLLSLTLAIRRQALPSFCWTRISRQFSLTRDLKVRKAS